MGWWSGEPLIQGDEGADIMGEALDKLRNLYREKWGRSISKEEVLAYVEFCYFTDEQIEEMDREIIEKN